MIRVMWRIAALIALLISGLLILFSVSLMVPHRQRARIRQRWSRRLLQVCGMRLALHGDLSSQDHVPPRLVVMNHVSWLDIFVLNAFLPVTFVAKSEIRRWPIVGWLVSGTGTIFIERGNRHAVRHVNHEIRRRLSRQEHVAFFPEGTTSSGHDVLRFHTSLFGSVLYDETPAVLAATIQPIAIRYFQNAQKSLIPAYIDDDTLVGSILKILGARGLSAELTVLPPVVSLPDGTTRHELAAQLESQLRQAITA
jgi:1-acyl-sn-glycerol-3-phosphate acyltransferase